jgi:hypothetical protein
LLVKVANKNKLNAKDNSHTKKVNVKLGSFLAAKKASEQLFAVHLDSTFQ